MGEICERGQKVQTSSYKINQGDVLYSMVIMVNTILYKISHHMKKIIAMFGHGCYIISDFFRRYN